MGDFCSHHFLLLFQIIFVILPFLMISGATLIVFTFLYFVNFSKLQTPDGEYPYATFRGSFYKSYADFVGGPDYIEYELDIIFGIVIVLILLNVVIAIVTDAWKRATDPAHAKQVFWRYRLNFILDVTRGTSSRDSFFACLKWIDDLGDTAKEEGQVIIGRPSSKSSSRTRQSIHSVRGSNTRKNIRSVEPEEPSSSFGKTFLLYPLVVIILPILGFFSFGQLWPLYIRLFLFTQQDDDEEHKPIEKQIGGLIDQNKLQVATLQEEMVKLLSMNRDLLYKNEKQSEELSMLRRKQSEEMAELRASNIELFSRNKQQVEELQQQLRFENRDLKELMIQVLNAHPGDISQPLAGDKSDSELTA